MKSLTLENRMMVAGHRGDCYNCFENTMKAFETAINAGADMIESDVHLTKDGANREMRSAAGNVSKNL